MLTLKRNLKALECRLGSEIENLEADNRDIQGLLDQQRSENKRLREALRIIASQDSGLAKDDTRASIIAQIARKALIDPMF